MMQWNSLPLHYNLALYIAISAAGAGFMVSFIQLQVSWSMTKYGWESRGQLHFFLQCFPHCHQQPQNT